MGNFLSGAYTPHPNSLMFNGLPVFWPFKVYWFFRKFGEIVLMMDFPTPPAGHPDLAIKRRYFALHNPFASHKH
jgi:hypothetical protein